MKYPLVFLSMFLFSAIADSQIYIEQAKLSGAGASGHPFFGYTVALSGTGSYALVGGPYDNADQGALWFFSRSSGSWTQLGSKISIADTGYSSDYSQLGSSISLSSDGTVAVAAYFWGAYILTRTDSSWTSQCVLVPDEDFVGNVTSVAISADASTIILGEQNQGGIGVAHVFVRSGSSWTLQSKLEVGVEDDLFGWSVAIAGDGNTALVGAFGDDSERGATYVFTRSSGVWSQQAKLVVEGSVAAQSFGWSVALSSDGSTALVGGPSDNAAVSGAAWVFTRSSGSWSSQAKLAGTDVNSSGSQGKSVSLSGDGNLAIVGAPDDGSEDGAAVIYVRSSGVWTQVDSKLTGSGSTGYAFRQGYSVAMSQDGSTAIVGGWGGPQLIGAAWVYGQQKLAITAPKGLEVLHAGDPYDIQWKSSGVDSLQIRLSIDSGQTYKTIVASTPASTGYRTYAFPDTLLSAKCRLKIVDCSDTTTQNESGLFRIKPYVLTRFKANGDYELFDPAIHSWQFKNDSSQMWPSSWYSRFNYWGKDPYTQKDYPSYFSRSPFVANSSIFIDWPLFVRTFGEATCYQNVSNGVYSYFAVRLWFTFSDPYFMGSCFGFSQSCLLAFDEPNEFLQAYPEVGAIEHIHDIQLTDSLRQVVNLLYEHEYGYQHWMYYCSQYLTHDVRKTLEECKTYFLSDTVYHRSLTIASRKGAHSVVPYRLETQGNGRYILDVYDNNRPYGSSTQTEVPYVLLDSATNRWSYAPLNWSDSSRGVFLTDCANTYLGEPLLWYPVETSSRYNSLKKIADSTSYSSLFANRRCVVEISSLSGQTIGYRDSTSFNTLDNSCVIQPQNGSEVPPLGYFVPDGTYSIHVSSFADTLSDLSVLNTTGMLSYWRSDAAKSQTDRLTYDGGLAIGNGDAQTKNLNLEVIARLTASERVFQILDCPAVHGDSLRILAPDNSRLSLANFGPAKTYDLRIMLAGESASGLFYHERVALPAYSTHTVVPDWQDLTNHSVTIYQDAGNTGTITDSLVLANQATVVRDDMASGLPAVYSLDQNYPNPFNPSTVISYHLPVASHVTLRVYDMLGREVRTLVNEHQAAGSYSVTLNAVGLSSGVYFYRLQAGAFAQTKKLVVLK